MKPLIETIKTALSKQLNNLPELVVRLISVAVLLSHILSHAQWFNSDITLSVLVLGPMIYIAAFFLFIAISLYVIYKPKRVTWLICAMLVMIFLNIHIITPFWYNYLLMLIFARIDNSMKLVIWSLGIQEIWAGLTKINPSYINVVGFFSEPFSGIAWLPFFVAACVLLIPILEIATGITFILHKKISQYTVLLVHGGAIIILMFFVHYAVKAWVWNALVIILILILLNKMHENVFNLTRLQVVLVICTAFIPLTQMKTTLVYPLSYRMYSGSETNMIIDGESYEKIYSEQAKEFPYMSDVIYEIILKKQCDKSEFNKATITVPKFLLRKKRTTSYKCVNTTLVKDIIH